MYCTTTKTVSKYKLHDKFKAKISSPAFGISKWLRKYFRSFMTKRNIVSLHATVLTDFVDISQKVK